MSRPAKPGERTASVESVGNRETVSHPTEFARARNRRLASGILTSVASRGVAALVPLVMIPLTLNYMGTETYGLWMAVTALTGMAAFADLGLGNGLMTKLAPCYAHNDHRTARTHISNAYAVVGLAAALSLAVLLGTASLVPWHSMLNSGASGNDRSTASLVAVTCLAAFIANIPLSLILRVQYAYQMVGQANIWQATGSLWSIPLVAGAVHLDLGVGVVVAAAVVGPPLANVANSLWLYKRRLPELAPSLGGIDARQAHQLLGLGGQFLVLTIVMSIATNADQLIAAHTLGLNAVTTYSVPARLFGQLGMLVSLVNLPLWPANGEALAKGDTRWVRTITRRMTVASALAIAAPGIAFVLAGDALLSVWLGSDLGASPALMSGLALWWVMLAAISPYFMVQNSVGVLMPQLAGWTLYLVVSVPLKIVAAPVFGLEGIVFAGVIPYAVLVVPAAIWGYRTALRRAEPRSAQVST